MTFERIPPSWKPSRACHGEADSNASSGVSVIVASSKGRGAKRRRREIARLGHGAELFEVTVDKTGIDLALPNSAARHSLARNATLLRTPAISVRSSAPAAGRAQPRGSGHER